MFSGGINDIVGEKSGATRDTALHDCQFY